jgi:hypothetical protein
MNRLPETRIRPRPSATSELLQLLTSWTLRYLFLAAICAAQRTSGQWVPPAALRNVPILANCQMTKHGVGVSLQPTLFYPHGAIFLCPEREREIDRRRPGASRFFLVHEYGHLAMHTREEAIADEWAAKQLAGVPVEQGTLRAVLLFFVDEGTLFDPLYGTGFDRALRVARAADVPESDWPPPLVAFAKAQEGLRANGASLILRVKSSDANAAQMVICVDRQPIGVLSNVDGKGRLELPMLVPGPHLIQALQVWLYQTEPSSGEKSEVARKLQAECEFVSTGKHAIGIELRFDGDSLSMRAEEL